MGPEMRLVFLGSGEFGIPALEHLTRQELAPRLVISQPSRPAGRGRRPAPPPLLAAAVALGPPVAQPERIAEPQALALLREAAPDFLVVVDYGQILPAAVLALPRAAAVNLHGSLLPRWRGAAPVARAILAGDRVSGVTTIRMDAGVDTGAILMQKEVPIQPHDTTGDLEARLARTGAPLLEATLRGLAAGALEAKPQPRAGATRAPRLGVEEARLDWSLAAEDLERRIRAFNPRPGAWTVLGEERLKVWHARPAHAEKAPGDALPGRVARATRDGVTVECGTGALELLEVQFAGGRRLSAEEAIHGRKIRAGQRLGA